MKLQVLYGGFYAARLLLYKARKCVARQFCEFEAIF